MHSARLRDSESLYTNRSLIDDLILNKQLYTTVKYADCTTFYTQQLGDKKDLPKVQCIKCGRTGNLTTKKTKSHGTTYEYYYVQHYIKETDKIEWCYLGNYDKLPHKYKDKLKKNTVHKESDYTQNHT